jgi:hypothetical protein
VLTGLLLVGEAQPVSAEPETAGRSVEQFRTPDGPCLSTDDPALKTALAVLYRARPAAVAFGELAAAVAGAVGRVDETHLARSLLGCAMSSFVALHSHLPAVAARPGERPRAAGTARRQAAGGKLIVNLRHKSIELDDVSRAVLALADGTRSRAEIADELRRLVESGGLRPNAETAKPGDLSRAEAARTVDEILEALAKLWLLMS